MSQHFKDYLELHFLVVLWGFTAILGLLISIPPVEVVFYRTLISAAVLGIGLYIAKENLRVSSRELLKMLGVGFLFSIHWMLFFASARVSNASVCLAGMATTALWTGIIEPFYLKRRLSIVEILLSVVAMIGIIIISNTEVDRVWGLFLAIVSAMLAAVFTVLNKKLVTKHKPFVIMFYEMAGAFLMTLLFLPVYQSFSGDELQLGLQGYDLLFLSILAVVCTVYAFSMSVKLMQRLTAFSINMTINLEPVYGIILALLILGDSEKMKAGFYFGAFLIVISVFAYPILMRRKTR